MRPICLLLCCIIAGCVHARPSTRAAEAASARFRHTVRYPGETLGLIAVWYTGAAGNWPKLAKFNAVGDPRQLQIGDHILIPNALIRRWTPLPRSLTEQQRASSRFNESKSVSADAAKSSVPAEASQESTAISEEALLAARKMMSELRTAAELSVYRGRAEAEP